MIKFTLILWVCSFLSSPSVCMPPVTYPNVYDSWLECSKAAHLESIKLMESFDVPFINENKVGMKYSCQQGRVY
jgi:hypothetical protein